MVTKETKLIYLGRNPEEQHGAVNPPIYQTSTVIFPTLESYDNAESGKVYYSDLRKNNHIDPSYGLAGTPTTFALQDAIMELEGGDICVITQSGLSAITTALLSFLSTGDHLLMVDSVYGPTRRFCNKDLKRFGIETTYYDPLIGSNIADLIQENTKVIFMESPGSLMFEMQDVPTIARIAKEHNIITMLDNSWATPLYFSPIEHGVNISIQAITKYIGGHSDLLLGAIIAKGDSVVRKLLYYYKTSGASSSPSDCYQALRGMRTMAARLEKQQKTVMEIVNWIKDIPQVVEVLYPPYERDKGHEVWKKLYTGGASLFTIILDKKYDKIALSRMIDNLKLFGIGASWGGFESLILTFEPESIRSATEKNSGVTYIRIYIGLEDSQDLINDLGKGFERLFL